MSSDFLLHGKLHAPYFIFLRCGGSYSDAELLNRFGISTYRPRKAAQRLDRYAVFADDGQWTMIADDWYYTLWHMPSTRPTIAALAASCDVFACSVGDCDHSFDFVYYQGSRLVRKYVVTDPDFRGGVVVENIGDPLPCEAAAFEQADELSIVLEVAAALGIKTNYGEGEIRVYAPVPSTMPACRLVPDEF